jgi:hypothetical protein
MSELVTDCPRCNSSKITFDLVAAKLVRVQHEWKGFFESFCICRNCSKTTVFVLSQNTYRENGPIEEERLAGFADSVNNHMKVEAFISLRDFNRAEPPAHLPSDILGAFNEGATCIAVNCFNAAGTMFRLCVDRATWLLLPSGDAAGLNDRVRRSLGLRLQWLFENGKLPSGLRELSKCIREDGNDGAHAGNLLREDAEDLLDFTYALLERLYTEPENLRLAEERRNSRRAKK